MFAMRSLWRPAGAGLPIPARPAVFLPGEGVEEGLGTRGVDLGAWPDRWRLRRAARRRLAAAAAASSATARQGCGCELVAHGKLP
jgi:hypothetical protein